MISSVWGYAHGDLDLRIAEVTAEIKENPDSSFLFIKRAKLHFQHETYRKSLRDLRRSQKLRYSSAEQKLLFAKNYFRLGKFEKSMTFIDEILHNDTHHVLAIKLKAKNYFEQGNYHNSAIAYEQVIENTSKSFPANYIDASYAWEAMDTDEGKKGALIILDKGIEEFGDIIILHERLKEFGLNQNDYPLAIEAQLKIVEISPRKERPYLELSSLYQQNNDYQKARDCILLAREQYDKLPLRIKNTPAMKAFSKSLKSMEMDLQIK
jgi:tetratricopeptide (TPR) repeat protein